MCMRVKCICYLFGTWVMVLNAPRAMHALE
jgi:hypothetical protein